MQKNIELCCVCIWPLYVIYGKNEATKHDNDDDDDDDGCDFSFGILGHLF